MMYRCRYADAGDDAPWSWRDRIRVARLSALLLGCLSGVQSRCSVDWRVISEVEVDGKIKANFRLLEAVVCTLVLELRP